MKEITLKQLKLLNFKGVREKTIDFGHVTDIYGDNGTGKTTIMDAFLWLIFGKDSTDRKDFEIKTLDANNKAFHKMSHEVSAIINVDGDEVGIRHTYKENWPTKKGTATETFSGHKNEYYWNDVPLNETEFKVKVSTLLLDESLFKLITNTTYFNSLKWQDRRIVLEQLAGEITNEMVLATLDGTGDFTELIKALNTKKTLQEYRLEIGSKKKLIRDEKDLLPSRIDEAKRSLPDFVNYTNIEKQLADSKKELENIEAKIYDRNLVLQEKQKGKTEKLKQLHTISSSIQNIEFEERNKVQASKRERDQVISNYENQLTNKKQSLGTYMRDVQNNEEQKKRYQSQQQELRESFAKVNAEVLTFNEGEFHCPTCKREYEAKNVEKKKTELTKNFNEAKSKKLTEINERGVKIGEEIKVIDARLLELKKLTDVLINEVTTLQAKIETARQENITLSANDAEAYEMAIASNQEYSKLKSQVDELNVEINTPIDTTDNSDLIQKKNEITSMINGYQRELASKGQREKIEARIIELQNQESEMAQELSRLEGIEYSIMQFEKSKMDMLEMKVNGMFKIVQFKMFEDKINGGQAPCCETLINGVPYSDANTASKIQAGIDIINALCKHHQVSAPIFIDNRESVFIIPESGSQIINLIASKPDKQLRIERAA